MNCDLMKMFRIESFKKKLPISSSCFVIKCQILFSQQQLNTYFHKRMICRNKIIFFQSRLFIARKCCTWVDLIRKTSHFENSFQISNESRFHFIEMLRYYFFIILIIISFLRNWKTTSFIHEFNRGKNKRRVNKTSSSKTQAV